MAKRLFSFLLVLIMVFSVVPVQVFATDADTADPAPEVHEEQIPGEETVDEILEEEIVPEEDLQSASEALARVEQAQEAIDALLEEYLGAADVSEEEMLAAVKEPDGETCLEILDEIADLEQTYCAQLTEEEFALLACDLLYAFADALAQQAAASQEAAEDEQETADEQLLLAADHTHVEATELGIPALCDQDGLTEGKYCTICGEVTVPQQIIPALGHEMEKQEAKMPTYHSIGWGSHYKCTRCTYTEGYVELPMLDPAEIRDYETFLMNLALLEELAHMYALENPGKDPLALVIKYIRTGVDRYNSGSWGIMAGSEDEGFAAFVRAMEDMVNSEASSEDEFIKVSGLKNIYNFDLPNGDRVDFGHMFGTMDITYHNNGSVNHADVGGWAGDVVDLLSSADSHGVSGTVEEMVAELLENYLCKGFAGESDQFGATDMHGDLDAYYLMQTLSSVEYENGMMTAIMMEYFTEELTEEDRAAFFLENRLDGVSLRSSIRTAVYNAYTGNKVIATLEGTREFVSSNLEDLRKACCYAFADYICKLAGDYVENVENDLYTIFSSQTSTLAPGITQDIKYATTSDGKQMVYYIATADITRDDVHVFANYNNNDPGAGWAMSRVIDQANAA